MQPPAKKILSVDGHRAADAFAAANGVDGPTLMETAGRAVAEAVIARWSVRPALVMCGPGNNGGDGFVVARHLAETGWPVTVATLGDPADHAGDAAVMRDRWRGPTVALETVKPERFGLLVDALFGAGLARPLDKAVAELARRLPACGCPCVSIDLPSGLQGDLGRPLETAFAADLTVTFHALKPAHLLQPGRSACGEIVLADIGIPAGWEAGIPTLGEINHPAGWDDEPDRDGASAHKHDKGRLCVVSGGPSATGAARLAAAAGLRAGAGLVTLLTPPAALQVNALHTTAVMVQRFEDVDGFLSAMDDRRATALVIGPGNGVGADTRERVIAALSREAALVLDADALTSFEDDPAHLFAHLRPDDVMTPHGGEFARLFPDLAADETLSKIDRARRAAERAGCVLVFKGADTVIAAPDGRLRVNVHAAPALATAGTGDVLAGLIGGLMAQGQGGFEAACRAVWMHGEAGLRLGPGLAAEDLPSVLPGVRADLDRRRRIRAARQALLRGTNSA